MMMRRSSSRPTARCCWVLLDIEHSLVLVVSDDDEEDFDDPDVVDADGKEAC